MPREVGTTNVIQIQENHQEKCSRNSIRGMGKLQFVSGCHQLVGYLERSFVSLKNKYGKINVGYLMVK